MLFGTFTSSENIHEDLWFRLASITFTRTMTVPADGAWLYGDAISSRSYPNVACGKRWIATADPSVPSYVPFFRLGMVSGDVCGPTGYCLACGVRFGGTYTSPRTALITHAGSHAITVTTENGGGMNDAVQLWLAQVNRSDMEKMTIYRAKSETDASPAPAGDLAGEYFISNAPDEVLVVPKFHHAREFPVGSGLTYTATWDAGATSPVAVYSPGGFADDRILGVSVPKLATGSHTFTVIAKLPSGKTYTSNPLEVFVYAQTIYVTYGAFDPKNPIDQAGQFVPGATFDGTDVDLRSGPQLLQLNILVGRGSSGVFSVKLTNVSRYPGIAMNYPLDATDTNPDLDFGAGDLELFDVPIPKGGAPKVVRLPLYVYDYAAQATIEVTMPYRKVTFTVKRRLPVDLDNNGLPDAPWKIGTNLISPTGLTATSDEDDDNNVATPHKGDGLSAFEEMRGIIVGNTFTRLDPRKRDLFIVADADVLAFGGPLASATPITYLTPLPLWNHYLELDEVSGDDWPGRQLTKIKPVVNPNRAGVPGARATGQRALRVIHQSQFWPSVTVFLPTVPPVEQDIAIWQHGVFGATVLDRNDYDRIDRDRNGNLVTAFAAETPNGTSFVEWYAKTFENAGIHTDFTDGMLYGYHDENGNVVPPCLSPGDIDCDLWEDHLIVPRELPGGFLDELHTVPQYAGDYYTRRVFTCGDMVNDLPGGMSLQDFTTLRAAVVAHEIGHGMDIDHDTSCGSLMFDAMFVGVHRTMSDVVPLPSAFSPSHRAATRLKE